MIETRSLQRFPKLFVIPLSITVSPIYNVCLMLPNTCDNALHASAYIRNRVGQLKSLENLKKNTFLSKHML